MRAAPCLEIGGQNDQAFVLMQNFAYTQIYLLLFVADLLRVFAQPQQIAVVEIQH